MAFALTGARVHVDGALRDGLAVVVDGDRIAAVAPASTLAPGLDRVDLGGGILASGYVDLQVNGGGGVLLNDTPTPEAVAAIAAAHRAYGTTGLLPTVITDRPEVTYAAIDAVVRARAAGAREVLGTHVEGPFIDPKRRGAHPADCIRPIGTEDVDRLARAVGPAGCGAVLLTVSPAHVAPETIAKLVAGGVTVSLGHSEATAEQALAALAAGATGFTHLFNAMSPLGHRAPGMVGVALTTAEAYCGVIADGHHVDPLALKVALAAKPADRIVLVSDAMPPAAGGPDRFALQGRPVTRRAGRLDLDDGTLAGSNLTMAEAVRFVVHRLGVPVDTALAMAAANPVAWIGRSDTVGRIAPGLRADLVHLGDDLVVRTSWVAGARFASADRDA